MVFKVRKADKFQVLNPSQTFSPWGRIQAEFQNMPPLRPNLQHSTRMQARFAAIMSSAMVPFAASTGNPQPSSASQSTPKAATSKSKLRASANKAVYWEKHPHLTKTLLSWLWDHLADRAILFNEKRDQDAGGNTGKPQARHKKEINVIITAAVFSHDRTYGETYIAHPQWKLAMTWYDMVWQDMTSTRRLDVVTLGHTGSYHETDAVCWGTTLYYNILLFSYYHTCTYLVISCCTAMHLVQYAHICSHMMWYYEVTPGHKW